MIRGFDVQGASNHAGAGKAFDGRWPFPPTSPPACPPLATNNQQEPPSTTRRTITSPLPTQSVATGNSSFPSIRRRRTLIRAVSHCRGKRDETSRHQFVGSRSLTGVRQVHRQHEAVVGKKISADGQLHVTPNPPAAPQTSAICPLPYSSAQRLIRCLAWGVGVGWGRGGSEDGMGTAVSAGSDGDSRGPLHQQRSSPAGFRHTSTRASTR